MRACSFICCIVVVFIIINQFYSGLNYKQLSIGSFVLIAIWIDSKHWLRYKLRKARLHIIKKVNILRH